MEHELFHLIRIKWIENSDIVIPIYIPAIKTKVSKRSHRIGKITQRKSDSPLSDNFRLGTFTGWLFSYQKEKEIYATGTFYRCCQVQISRHITSVFTLKEKVETQTIRALFFRKSEIENFNYARGENKVSVDQCGHCCSENSIVSL